MGNIRRLPRRLRFRAANWIARSIFSTRVLRRRRRLRCVFREVTSSRFSPIEVSDRRMACVNGCVRFLQIGSPPPPPPRRARPAASRTSARKSGAIRRTTRNVPRDAAGAAAESLPDEKFFNKTFVFPATIKVYVDVARRTNPPPKGTVGKVEEMTRADRASTTD